ncbi:hypothetical protein GBAR_LOCUS14740 [Geodia barretti]|uniref:Uncharacterized protein n=1 Tax=Geodia barretti TaxID=519541 RepID=A0AA35WSY7_GEOBA|nr:hypothetical protein GBAR_LOCUS14740 [Geodia barretti]
MEWSPVRRGGVEGGEEGGEGGSGPGCTAGGLRTRSREMDSRLHLEALLGAAGVVTGEDHHVVCSSKMRMPTRVVVEVKATLRR